MNNAIVNYYPVVKYAYCLCWALGVSLIVLIITMNVISYIITKLTGGLLKIGQREINLKV